MKKLLIIALIICLPVISIAGTEFNYKTGKYEQTYDIDDQNSFDHKGNVYHTDRPDNNDGTEYRFNYKTGEGEYRYNSGDTSWDSDGNVWQKVDD